MKCEVATRLGQHLLLLLLLLLLPLLPTSASIFLSLSFSLLSSLMSLSVGFSWTSTTTLICFARSAYLVR